MKSVSAYYFPQVWSWTTSTTSKVSIFLDLLILSLRNTRGNHEREHQSEAKPWPCPRIISGARKSAMPQIVKVRSSDICFANRKSINCNNKVGSSLVQCKMADFLEMISQKLRVIFTVEWLTGLFLASPRSKTSVWGTEFHILPIVSKVILSKINSFFMCTSNLLNTLM